MKMIKPNTRGLRTWIEIDTKAFRHNYNVFRKLAGQAQLMAVVKSNAYGHGLIDSAQFLEQCGVDWFGVDSIMEALALRREGITKPILVLGYTLPEQLARAASQNISVTISSFESLEFLNKTKLTGKLKIHIKIDSGMHRQGFEVKDLAKVLPILKVLKNVEVEGIYSHLADPAAKKFTVATKKQIAVFGEAVKLFKQAGFKPLIHLAATPALLAYPNETRDMVRIGLGLYGIWPEESLAKSANRRRKWKITLRPVLTWKTIISEIKTISKGEAVGYGFSEVLKRETKLAICPIGYWHGYPRALSSVGEVLVRGQRAKIIGRVSMDMIMIDVTNIKGAKVGDEVTLFDTKVLASEAAQICNTIPYEIITTLNPLIKRFYI